MWGRIAPAEKKIRGLRMYREDLKVCSGADCWSVDEERGYWGIGDMLFGRTREGGNM